MRVKLERKSCLLAFFLVQESDDEECFKDQEEAEEDEEKFVDADKEVESEERSTMENSAKTNDSNSTASWVHHLNMRGTVARKYNSLTSNIL